MPNTPVEQVEYVMDPFEFTLARERFTRSTGVELPFESSHEEFINLVVLPHTIRPEFSVEATRLTVHFMHIKNGNVFINPEATAEATELIRSLADSCIDGRQGRTDKIVSID